MLVASKNTHLAVMRALLSWNADPNLAETGEGVTPIYVASLRGQLTAVQVHTPTG